MTFPGAPAIFYGDETGLRGENDPDCRRAMNWEDMDEELHRFFHKMISLRRNSPALRQGSYKPILCENKIYSFVRCYKEESVFVILNNSAETQTITLPIEGRTENFKAVLPAYCFEIF
jgi:glycosidase